MAIQPPRRLATHCSPLLLLEDIFNASGGFIHKQSGVFPYIVITVGVGSPPHHTLSKCHVQLLLATATATTHGLCCMTGRGGGEHTAHASNAWLMAGVELWGYCLDPLSMCARISQGWSGGVLNTGRGKGTQAGISETTTPNIHNCSNTCHEFHCN